MVGKASRRQGGGGCLRVSAGDHDSVLCCGQRVSAGWPRFLGALAALWVLSVLVAGALRDDGPPSREQPGPATRTAAERAQPPSQVASSGGPQQHDLTANPRISRPRVQVPHKPIPPLCHTGRANSGTLEGSLALLGHAGRLRFVEPVSEQACLWRDKTDAQVPFRMCLMPLERDEHISASIFKSGQWNAAKKETLQAVLPNAFQAETIRRPDSPAGRSRRVVIDIGASTGFFSILAAVRGYDVIAVEPVVEQAARIAASARANGCPVASPPASGPKASAADARAALLQAAADWSAARAAAAAAEAAAVSARAPALALGTEPGTALPDPPGSVLVLGNAASDDASPVTIGTHAGNPGASFVDAEAQQAAASLRARTHGSAALPPGSTAWAVPVDALAGAGLFRPDEVAAIKISAEAWDARALNGLRTIIGEGRPPLVHIVFNAAHVASRGCNPVELLLTFVRWGYRAYDSGAYRATEDEIRTMVRNFGQRSVELSLVEQSVRL